jgi:CCR4-NOT transcriptional complex subunit CAF120
MDARVRRASCRTSPLLLKVRSNGVLYNIQILISFTGSQTSLHAEGTEGYRSTSYGDLTRVQQAQAAENAQRVQRENPAHAAARQNIWAQALSPDHQVGAMPNSDTFVRIEAPEQTMTKAFTPHGLLSAGLQDKYDRSAKRQEELARETGASLLNVANKPPPPQTGLLGAITAHERERKRDGGFGAALTERERDKRLAEERQRKIDDFQRQQLEMVQGGGSMYGGYMNPMMGMMGPMSPMMTGMGGMAPMNPMMTGMYNPQHMFAAQQAAQAAYQQAMMAFSMAGSQVGGDGASGAGTPGQAGMAPMNPMMTGMSMPMMGGFDPRMSMMGMPFMGGMGPMGPMNPMGMQMTGSFDPRFAGAQGGFDTGLRPPGMDTGKLSSPTSANGSPALRSGDGGELPATPSGAGSRSASPRQPPT